MLFFGLAWIPLQSQRQHLLTCKVSRCRILAFHGGKRHPRQQFINRGFTRGSPIPAAFCNFTNFEEYLAAGCCAIHFLCILIVRRKIELIV